MINTKEKISKENIIVEWQTVGGIAVEPNNF